MPEILLQHVTPFVLVLARLGGLFLLSPILSSAAVPRQVRFMLLLGLTAVVYPTIPVQLHATVSLDLYDLGPIIVRESLIGIVLGLLALLPFAAVQLAGLIMGQQVGLAFAQIVNPAADIEGDAMGQFLFHLAMAAFLILGGLEALVDATVRSFTLIPLGGFGPRQLPVEELASLFTAGLNLAYRISMPVLAIIFIENIVLGFITKTLPQLNVMSFGFPVRIMLGVGVLIASMGFVAGVITDDVEATIGRFHDCIELFGESAADPPAEGRGP